MNVLLLILSVMTWTVKDKNTVTGDGAYPYSIEANYSCTNTKGTVRANDEAVLTLTNMGGITVEQVEVYVRSNKTGGAGQFTVSINGRNEATKSGSLKDWVGAYDNTNYHAVKLLSKTYANANELEITLVGTANSLYIEKYVITWSPAQPHTVTLMNGIDTYATVSETDGGDGILLPNMDDYECWYFVGWSTWEFWAIHSMPTVYKANTVYYPASDETLWAMYVYHNPTEQTLVTDLVSGDYLYVNTDASIALAGVPDENGRMGYLTADPTNEKLYYTVDLVTDTTAYITHTSSQTPIGYSDGLKMVAKKSLWKIYHDETQTLFYMEHNGKKYVLWLNVWDTGTGDTYAGLQVTNNLTSPMALMIPNSSPEEPTFTCHPESGYGIQFVPDEKRADYILQIGNYRLMIKDGKKMMQL